MLKNISQFDKYNRLEKPQLVLCELSKEPLVALYALDVSLKLNFIDISSIKFNIPKIINGEPYKHYDDVVELRLIYVKDIGYFQITSLIEQSDGLKEYKECEAFVI